MNKNHIIIIISFITLLSACSSPNVVSEEERIMQNTASEAVTALLFENELESLASYNVRRDGLIVIKFHESVKKDTYTDIVTKLRKTDGIKGVYAEQGGVEVCSL